MNDKDGQAEEEKDDLVGAEFEEAGSGAWSRYELYTADDGRVKGICTTNDDGDTGYPGQYADWKVEYRDKAEMLRQLSGGTHFGISGVKVEVYLDGEEVGTQRTHAEL